MNEPPNPSLQTALEALRFLEAGDYAGALRLPLDSSGDLGASLGALARSLEAAALRQQKLNALTARIDAGLLLDDILETVFQDFRQIIPYQRIGLSLLGDEGQSVRAVWAKSDLPEIHLGRGYTAPLDGSSLNEIIHTACPRILNDLPAYLEQHPASESTRLIVQEGFRASLTCPLIANGKPVGFLFFSNNQTHAYHPSHVDLFQAIASQVSLVVEKGRLVSDLAAQTTAIQAQNDELRRLNDLKNTLLGITAHDLRTPIGNIRMSAGLIMDQETWGSPADRAAFIESFLPTLDRQTRHMMDLLDDLLDLSLIEAGKLTLEKEDLDLASFLGEVIRRQAQLAQSKGTQVLLVGPPEGSVQADPNRLAQVFDNLISNAVKYSPPGSTVQIYVEFNSDGWRFCVQDQGPGITQADRLRLFQNFARLSARPTGGEKSTGLGLAITRRVVEAHGGQIGVDSAPGGGAIFWFTLPENGGGGS